jgi:hypothetical protein
MDDANPENTDEILPPVKWWEKKRLSYNLWVGGTGLIATLFCGLPVLMTTPFWVITHIALYGFVVNIFYSFGWGIEMLSLNYFNKNYTEKYRHGLFVFGTLVSILITLFLGLVTYPMIWFEF